MSHLDASNSRIEKDSMGDVQVPADALYGAQTQRAVDNFPISGLTFDRGFIRALGLIKLACAGVNNELDRLDDELAEAIAKAATEVAEGRHDAHFPIDIFQTGSGTSSNMNTNEVVANRANQILGQPLGAKSPVHPNDHVNMGAVFERCDSDCHSRIGQPGNCGGPFAGLGPPGQRYSR